VKESETHLTTVFHDSFVQADPQTGAKHALYFTCSHLTERIKGDSVQSDSQHNTIPNNPSLHLRVSSGGIQNASRKNGQPRRKEQDQVVTTPNFRPSSPSFCRRNYTTPLDALPSYPAKITAQPFHMVTKNKSSEAGFEKYSPVLHCVWKAAR
jgi:hypothetical protein